MATDLDRSGLDVDAIRAFLQRSGIDLADPITVDLLQGGRSNLTYRVRSPGADLVVRRPPLGGLTPSAHDVVREYTVMSHLQDSAVPVPPTVGCCEDTSVIGAPFVVLEYVDGVTLRGADDLESLDDDTLEECTTELMRVLVALHQTDPVAVGLESFGRPTGYLTRQIALWRRQWDRVQTRDLPLVDQVHAALEATTPTDDHAAIVHGDYRVDNTILDRATSTRVRAVVDWEMSTLGDPYADLALMCAYTHPAFDAVLGQPAASTSPRMASPETLIARYESASGREVPNRAFYQAFAYFKLAVIAEGIWSRYQQGVVVGSGYETADEAVPSLLEAADRTLRES